jgi:hypothetical protein
MTRVEEFMAVYSPKLKQVMAKHPGQFMVTHDKLVERVKNSLDTKGVMQIDINTISWRHAAKHFGHANTYTAWRKWFENA